MAFMILSAGRDLDLLKFRSAFLRKRGFQVVTASDSPELINKLFSGDFDLVLLCDSLREEDLRRATGLIKLYTPSTPVILISSIEGRQYPYGDLTVPNRPAAIETAIEMAAAMPVRIGTRASSAA